MTSSSLCERIAARAGLVGIDPTPDELALLSHYYELLERWNRKINLTALHLADSPDETLDKLIVEPIAVAEIVTEKVQTWFDLGSGGGSPAIPLKIMRPAPALTMVESRSRKSAFLREVARSLNLSNASIWTGRIEELSKVGPRQVAELVTVRAVRIDHALVDSAVSLLVPGGRLAIFGRTTPPDIDSLAFIYEGSTRLPTRDGSVHRFVRG